MRSCLLTWLGRLSLAWPGLLGLQSWFGSIGLLGSIGFPGLRDMPDLLDFLGFWRNRLAWHALDYGIGLSTLQLHQFVHPYYL